MLVAFTLNGIKNEFRPSNLLQREKKTKHSLLLFESEDKLSPKELSLISPIVNRNFSPLSSLLMYTEVTIDAKNNKDELEEK